MPSLALLFLVLALPLVKLTLFATALPLIFVMAAFDAIREIDRDRHIAEDLTLGAPALDLFLLGRARA
ncbi:MAG: hypothetical protein V1267_08970 [Alphaproteobacteria bacterium]|jgi:hypothetical protein|nr:hypothetical protein [Alphaproteobacteria bacterium]HJM60354.1 hypothetical protein [Alphaproteobacteria bacterium]